MSEDFRAVSARLAGLTPAITGWTPPEFWNATPAELAVILMAFEESDPGNQTALPIDYQQLEKLKEIHPDAK